MEQTLMQGNAQFHESKLLQKNVALFPNWDAWRLHLT